MIGVSDRTTSDPGIEAARTAFRKRLKELRLQRGWTPTKAASVSKVGRSGWYRFERGDADPSLTNLIRLQRAFELDSIEALFGAFPTGRALERPATGDGGDEE